MSQLTKENIVNFIEGNVNYLFKSSLPEHYVEQAQYRASKCEPCTKAGACLYCGCSIPQMYLAPDKTCPKGKWGKYLPLELWEEFKKKLKSKTDFKTKTETKTETETNPIPEHGR